MMFAQVDLESALVQPRWDRGRVRAELVKISDARLAAADVAALVAAYFGVDEHRVVSPSESDSTDLALYLLRQEFGVRWIDLRKATGLSTKKVKARVNRIRASSVLVDTARTILSGEHPDAGAEPRAEGTEWTSVLPPASTHDVAALLRRLRLAAFRIEEASLTSADPRPEITVAIDGEFLPAIKALEATLSSTMRVEAAAGAKGELGAQVGRVVGGARTLVLIGGSTLIGVAAVTSGLADLSAAAEELREVWSAIVKLDRES